MASPKLRRQRGERRGDSESAEKSNQISLRALGAHLRMPTPLSGRQVRPRSPHPPMRTRVSSLPVRGAPRHGQAESASSDADKGVNVAGQGNTAPRAGRVRILRCGQGCQRCRSGEHRATGRQSPHPQMRTRVSSLPVRGAPRHGQAESASSDADEGVTVNNRLPATIHKPTTARA